MEVITFAEFRSLLNNSGLSEKETWLFYRSFKRTLFALAVHQKKFKRNLASEIEYQKIILERIKGNCSGPIKKLILNILLDDAKFDAANFGKEITDLDRYLALLELRINRYKIFFRFSNYDKRRFEAIAMRMERKQNRETRNTKTAWRRGVGIATVFVAAVAAGATLYKLAKED